MAEAFAALSIAANIAQFVGYGLQLFSDGKEAYNSLHGAKDEHHELEVVITDIKSLCEEVKDNPVRPEISSDEKAFRQLALECGPLADKLRAILDDLKVSKDARFRLPETVRQTIKSSAKKKDIQRLQKRLLDIDVRLRARALEMLQKNNHSHILSAINDLRETSTRMKINTSFTLDQMRIDILDIMGRFDKLGKVAASQTGVGSNIISRRLAAFSKEGEKVDQQQRALQSLVFESMKQREEKIKDAHKSTLTWIFREPETRFMEWLAAENGIYWVKGKAGSGKSTLLKYICDHDTTLQVLRRWAGSQQLFTASYFFWNSGLPMQKSQTGLLQSLLYQLLLACPLLILETCSDHVSGQPWTRKELFEALMRISQQIVLPAKICFFVDGLDEYDGDDEDIISLLQDLAASPSIKICVSSRPWNSFMDAFDEGPRKLALEDLTKNDMENYVRNMLVENKLFAKVSEKDRRCNDLIPQIVERAHGVWLWVYLVVRDLLRDLKGEERYPFLQRRLDSFPDELEKYFESILERIDKIHRQETAMIFLITVEAVRPLPVLAFEHLDMEQQDPRYALKADISTISQEEASEVFKRWRKLLNSRCRDLLEVNVNDSEDTFLKYKVDFLHRTVRDFLRSSYQEELKNRAPNQFDARLSLCNIILVLIKRLHPKLNNHRLNQLFGLVDEMLYYALEMERKSGSSNTDLLDALDHVNMIHSQEAGFLAHWTNIRDSPTPPAQFQEYGQCTYLALTIQARLRLYVKEKLDANPELLEAKRGRPLLDYALRPKRVTPAELPYQIRHDGTNIDVRLVSYLLSKGADPNQNVHIYPGHTVWSLFLLYCLANASTVPAHLKNAWYSAAQHLIDYGANPAVEINIDAASGVAEEVKKFGKTARYKRDVVPTHLTVAAILQTVFSDDIDKVARLQARMVMVAQKRQSQSSIFWRMVGWN